MTRMLKSTQTIIAVLLLSLGGATAAKAQWPAPNVYYKIQSWGCVEIRPWSNVKVRPCADLDGQYWRFIPAGNGYFNLTNLASGRGMCLTVGDPSIVQFRLRPCANSND